MFKTVQSSSGATPIQRPNGLLQNQPIVTPVATLTPPTATPNAPPQDKAQLTAQGSALPTIQLDPEPPTWTAHQKAAILSSFQAGLKANDITPEELTQTLHKFGISQLEVTAENIQNPAYADEFDRIQQELDKRLNADELRALGQGNHVGHDGQFGKNSVAAVAALRDSDRGAPVELKVTPIKQQTRTGCYRTAEAMLWNVVHQKDGTDEAYTEFDTRGRIRDQDMEMEQVYAARSENGSGRVSVDPKRAGQLLDTLDQELAAGRPVIAGVSYRKQDGREYNEGVTDHFVLVSGRGQDQAGTYYTFQDPAGGGTHKLRLDPVSGRLSGKGDMRGIYDVTLIQHATSVDPATVERYHKMGKVLYSQGETSQELARLQTQLTRMGYDTHGVRGGYGNGTATAVRKFQQEHQLPVTGSSIDNHTRDAIGLAYQDYQRSHPTEVAFQKGQSSGQLSPLQKILTDHGYDTKGTKGSFGPGTEAAVKAFQAASGLTPSGKIDNQTWLKILELGQS